MNKNELDYIFYGTEALASDIEHFIQHIFKANEQAQKNNKRQTPICIWGFHGIGKTELVEQFAKNNNYAFSYIAPAQFEEMGDLLGMPTIKGDTTIFAAPEWVPQQEEKGILLIDDVNRADDRILRGIMQLLQNYELSSWKLPKGWQIVLTANPDGGDYSVTPLDDAMLTRMMHITMIFDVKEWAKWAEKNHVDSRGINFVLTYPEILENGSRTTPRSLVQFFQNITAIDDLSKELATVQLLADACLDKETAAAFIAYINDHLSELPSPDEILNSDNFQEKITNNLYQIIHKETFRVDILAALSTRLSNYILLNSNNISEQQVNNLTSFLQMEFLPNDLRLTIAQDLMSGDEKIRNIMAHPDLSAILLENM